MNELVTVVIPTHNRPSHLKKAVLSVFAQTYRPIELLVVDDGSREALDPSTFLPPDGVVFKVFRHDPGRGVAGARNRGIRESRGSWVAFLDDDDCWLPEKLALQIQALQTAEGPTIEAASCQMIVLDEHGRDLRRTAFPSERDTLIKGLLCADENLNPSTLIVRSKVFANIGLFDEALPTAEDRQWLLRYLMHYDVLVLSVYLVRYLEHTGERLTTNPELMLAGEKQFLQFAANVAPKLTSYTQRVMGFRYAKLGNEYMLTGKWLKGLISFANGIKHYPLEHRAWAGMFLGIWGPSIYRKVLAHRMIRVRLQTEH